jgi:hypothetical protein
VLGPHDFLPSPSRNIQKKDAFGASVTKQNDPRTSLEKIEGVALKPEVSFASCAVPENTLAPADVPKGAPGHSARTDIAFGMSDYGQYLYQADFSDLKRAAAREELSRFIVFQVFLDKTGRVLHIKKTSGSGDPFLDLFIQGKINNAVFKPSSAPRNKWMTVRFSLR